MRVDMDYMICELEEAAAQEGSECGDYWMGLCKFWRVVHYGGTDEFINEVNNEIVSQYDWFKDNFTWVEHEAIDCDKCGKGRPAYRELVWNDDL